MTEVQAAQSWPSNADLIADVARLGYIREADFVLDPTYGRGTWWAKYKPQNLTVHDIALDGVDFRKLPSTYMNRFDVIAFDPPYVSTGGRKTSTVSDFNERYGLVEAPHSPRELQTLICDGMIELKRCMVPHGIMLVKCMPYISSGKYFDGPFFITQHGLALGFDMIDRFIHVRHGGPQPPGRRQIHARNNYSELLVFRSRR